MSATVRTTTVTWNRIFIWAAVVCAIIATLTIAFPAITLSTALFWALTVVFWLLYQAA